MTQRQFEARSAKLLKAFEDAAKQQTIEQARADFRAEHKVIYVRRHVVEAYFRRYRTRRSA